MRNLKQIKEILNTSKDKTSMGIVTADTVDKSLAAKSIKTAKDLWESRRGQSPWGFFDWFNKTRDLVINDYNQDEYYQLFYNAYPGSPQDADNFLMTTLQGTVLDTPDLDQKEILLRNSMSRLPLHLQEHFKPAMDILVNTVSFKNASKASALYKDDLSKRASVFATKQWDTDVPRDVHLNDMVKLESLGLLQYADVYNGRLGVATKDGTVLPAFDINSASQVFPDSQVSSSNPTSAEIGVIMNIAPGLLGKTLDTAIGKQKQDLMVSSMATSELGFKMLEKGELDIPEWSQAIGLIQRANSHDVLNAGLNGYIETGKIASRSDLTRSMTTVRSYYGDLINDTTDPAPRSNPN